jgi:hypothetical protein
MIYKHFIRILGDFFGAPFLGDLQQQKDNNGTPVA